MNFRIADTFTASLARLTGEEQKAVKTTAFDLQMNPANPGMSFHKLDKARDKNFWSVRVSSDIRLIVHKTAESLLLCYVDHHDKAYQWAERRRLETHPTTGAAQWVEVRERVDEIVIRRAAPGAAKQVSAKQMLFGHMSDDDLLGWGVPTEWLAEIRAADEDSLLTLATQLPAEAAEALLELATGGTPRRPPAAPAGADPFAHPDAQRRFRVMQDVEELERALEFPWDQWTVFLHPAQRQWVERDHGGSARVSGSAGTGKTIVALHRAVYLARSNENARVLLTTFTPALAHALHTRLRRLVGRTPMLAERIDVVAMDELAARLFKFAFGKPALADDADWCAAYVDEAATALVGRCGGSTRRPACLPSWEPASCATSGKRSSIPGRSTVGRPIGTSSASAARRAFRKASVPPRGRFSAVCSERLRAEGRLTRAEVVHAVGRSTIASGVKPPFEHVVVDEAQDIGAPQLRFLAALAGTAAQRALLRRRSGPAHLSDFHSRGSRWVSMSAGARERCTSTTGPRIRSGCRPTGCSGPELADVDGNAEDRRGTVSVFNGPVPSGATEPRRLMRGNPGSRRVARRVRQSKEMRAGEIAVFVRSDSRARKSTSCRRAAPGLLHHVLDELVDTDSDEVSIGTMHLAKGLEFRCVAVMACDDEVMPLQERIDAVSDEADLKEVYDTERHLLYVACTRARDRLFVSGVEPVSEFLSDLS